jgi:hypothetical protein
MKRRGGSQKGGSIVNSNVVFIVVAIIAVFNVVAYMHVSDWSSIAVLLLAGVVTFFITSNRTLALVSAVVAASLFRATNNLEGLEMAKEEDEEEEAASEPEKPAKRKTKSAMEEPEVASGKTEKKKTMEDFFGAEGMSGQLDALQDNQRVLTNGIKALQPLMQQASAMLAGLPSGFLDKALKNMKKNSLSSI